ncbi:hypothetical protein AC1031_012253 [Aphanomyces cochlioides]|nr:hypothetical protein AC1031_012253 [Aphanomyces cochlioides]
MKVLSTKAVVQLAVVLSTPTTSKPLGTPCRMKTRTAAIGEVAWLAALQKVWIKIISDPSNQLDGGQNDRGVMWQHLLDPKSTAKNSQGQLGATNTVPLLQLELPMTVHIYGATITIQSAGGSKPTPGTSPVVRPTPSPSQKPTPSSSTKPTPSSSQKPTPSASTKPTPSPSKSPTKAPTVNHPQRVAIVVTVPTATTLQLKLAFLAGLKPNATRLRHTLGVVTNGHEVILHLRFAA